MKNSLYIKSQLDTTLAIALESSEELKSMFEAKINLLTWIYNNGNTRTQEELQIKLQNTEERLIALNFMGDIDPIIRKSIEEELKTLKDIIE